MKPRILVTGASGFIGHHVLPLLCERNIEIFALARSHVPEINGVNWIQLDLMQQDEIPKLLKDLHASHLVHLAWYTEPGKYWQSDLNLDWLTISIHLVRNFIHNGGQHIIIAGTCAEYDWHDGFCTEQTTPCVPDSLYGACKHALHIALRQHAIKNSCRLAWARLFFPFGPFQPEKNLLPTIINGMLNQMPVQCSEGSQKRDFIYIEDVASALTELTLGNYHGTFNIGSGSAVSIREIANYISSKFSDENLVSFSEITDPPPQPIVQANIERITEQSGWHPQYSLHHGIDKTIESLKSIRTGKPNPP